MLAIIFLLSIGTRLAYFASDPIPLTGPWLYGTMAHNILANGHWFQLNVNAPPLFAFTAPVRENGRLVAPAEADLKYSDAHPRWMPFVSEVGGESVLIAGIWEVTGREYWMPVALFRILLDAICALLVYHIAMRLFRRRRAALLAGAMYAAYPPIAQLVVSPNADFWGVELTIVVMAAYLEAREAGYPLGWLLACGLITGLSAYFRPFVLVLPAALALACIATLGWRATLRQAFAMTAVAALMLVPWIVRNYNDFHRFIPTRTGVGEALWAGLDEIPNSYGTHLSDYDSYLLLHRAHPDIGWISPAYDSYFGNRAVEVLERHPLLYARLVARRLWLSTIAATDVEWMRHGTKTPFAYPRGPLAYVFERPFQLVQVLLMPLVFLLAMLSMLFTWARNKREHLLLIAPVLVTILPYALLHFEPRYVIPAAFAYLIWIGHGADLLVERLSLRRTHAHDRAGAQAANAHTAAAKRVASKGSA